MGTLPIFPIYFWITLIRDRKGGAPGSVASSSAHASSSLVTSCLWTLWRIIHALTLCEVLPVHSLRTFWAVVSDLFTNPKDSWGDGVSGFEGQSGDQDGDGEVYRDMVGQTCWWAWSTLGARMEWGSGSWLGLWWWWCELGDKDLDGEGSNGVRWMRLGARGDLVHTAFRVDGGDSLVSTHWSAEIGFYFGM